MRENGYSGAPLYWGMGIDRVLQVLLGTRNIRDTVMFPLMRPEP